MNNGKLLSFKILDTETCYENKMIIHIFEKETKKVVKIHISWNSSYFFSNIKTKCNCSRNFCFLKCMHIKWFKYLYFYISDIKWNLKNILIFKEKQTNHIQKTGINTECLICFENLNYHSQNMKTCYKCYYSVHKLCFNTYVETYECSIRRRRCIHCQNMSITLY